MTVHLVYALHRRSLIEKVGMKLLKKTSGALGWVDRYGKLISMYPNYSPYSITKNLFESLNKSGFRVKLYDLLEKRSINIENGDVLIGHPEAPLWETAFGKTIINNQDKKFKKIVLKPLHFDFPHLNAFMNPIIPHVDKIIAITGQYWFENWSKSCFSDWLPKMVHCDMAIDIKHFPLVKNKFNSPGKRKFLFIGNDRDYKGCDVLDLLFQKATALAECTWIGPGFERVALKKISPQVLTPQYMEKIAAEHDFFITMGLADCNPTTILEAMAWGFPVCCTPTSGYYNTPSFFEFRVHDMDFNINQIKKLQCISETELYDIQKINRTLAEEKYNWEKFTSTVITVIEEEIKNAKF